MVQLLIIKQPFIEFSIIIPESVGELVAGELGIKTGGNNIFLDSRDSYKYIASQLERLRVFIKKYGKAIAIAHITRQNTPDALADYIPKFQEDGIEFVFLSELLE